MKPKVEGVCDLCGGELYQRKDDNEEALKVRLTHYNSETKPLLDYYSRLDLLKSFNSLVGKEQLFDEVCKYLQK
jgi:adenylate kinase